MGPQHVVLVSPLVTMLLWHNSCVMSACHSSCPCAVAVCHSSVTASSWHGSATTSSCHSSVSAPLCCGPAMVPSCQGGQCCDAMHPVLCTSLPGPTCSAFPFRLFWSALRGPTPPSCPLGVLPHHGLTFQELSNMGLGTWRQFTFGRQLGCVYVCVHVTECVCMHVHEYMHACLCMHVSVYACEYVSVYVCVHGCMHYVCVVVCMCACMNACVCMHACIHVCVCMHVCVVCRCVYVCMSLGSKHPFLNVCHEKFSPQINAT